MINIEAPEPPTLANESHGELLRIWRRVLKNDDLTVDEDFFESGGDSLLATEVLLEIGRLTGAEIPTAILFEVSTVRGLVDWLSRSTHAPLSPIIRFPSTGTQPPLFFFHGDYENGGYYVRNFANALAPGLSVIAVAPHGLDGEPVPGSIEEMATDRLPEIQRAQPQGPYRLGGHCIGGLVAFETARMLVAAGHEVELVALVDTPSMGVPRTNRLLLATLISIVRLTGMSDQGRRRILKSAMLRLADRPESGRLTGPRRNIVNWWLWWALFVLRHLRESGPSSDAPGVPDDRDWPMNQPLGRTYMALAAMYRPARLNVPLIFFSSHWSGRSWRRISSHAEVVELGGGHFDWITAHAEITGRLLQARLKGATELVPNLAYGADEASNPVFNIALAYQKTAALIAAVKLDIFTLIGSGTRTVGELSVDTGASTRGLRILCDYLTSLELLTKADVQYALAPAAARYLDRSSPSAVGSAIDFASAPEMLRLVLDDPVSYVRRGGSEGLANIAPDNPIWVRFARGMAPFAAVTAKRLAAYVVSQPDRPGTILDIAAGHGLYGIEMAKALPDAIVTAIDWSKVLVVAVENARAAGVDERLRTIAGSAFDVPWGVDFDLVLLPNFLHHFNREKNVSLLRKARESRSPGGRVYVVDFVPDADRVHPAFAANFAFWMLASTPGGDAYTFDDIRDMGEDAGFGHVTARPLPPTPQTLVVLEG